MLPGEITALWGSFPCPALTRALLPNRCAPGYVGNPNVRGQKCLPVGKCMPPSWPGRARGTMGYLRPQPGATSEARRKPGGRSSPLPPSCPAWGQEGSPARDSGGIRPLAPSTQEGRWTRAWWCSPTAVSRSLPTARAPLVVRIHPTKTTVTQGSEVILRCQASGNPPYNYYWSREDGQPLPSSAQSRRQGNGSTQAA